VRQQQERDEVRQHGKRQRTQCPVRVKIRLQWRLGRWGAARLSAEEKNYGARNSQQEVARWSAISCRAESRAAPEEEEKGDFPRDLFVKLKKHSGSTVN
jgi:hypothetical protein